MSNDQKKAVRRYQEADSLFYAKRHEEAFRLYYQSAEMGCAMAQSDTGYCYNHGFGVTRNLEQAIYWYTHAANQGLAIAQNNLGKCYEQGMGLYADRHKALKLYAQASSLCQEAGLSVNEPREDLRRLRRELNMPDLPDLPGYRPFAHGQFCGDRPRRPGGGVCGPDRYQNTGGDRPGSGGRAFH